ncbi:peptidase C15, pyroglutamyl peptidase I-like protein [Leucogyrophana mollusca]|uniref:Peptidase C15, pyroglutamyl peptidase I-like protein n=1 Tax=Leucogyrophana mollusca TaxID=85980 RepID=A0ACB8BPI1_9AGAM|nr:peptidase C15, pyroglutamyl peptidase I-like protein [Leucogyrophana mollusca]
MSPVQEPNGVHEHDDRPLNVLVTGFGPFSRYAVNPSWLAVKPLHNTVLNIDVLATPIMIDNHVVMAEPESPSTRPRQIHITAIEIPVVYEDVLAIVPGLHARPPVLPISDDPEYSSISTPHDGFDLIFHVGVAGRGPLRMERVGHKFGYNMKDAKGCQAPIVRREDTNRVPSEPSEAERMEMEMARLANYGMDPPNVVDSGEPPKRGFGKGYETYPEEIYTDIDVEKLVQYLKMSGVEQIYSSLDAGHYLCDFIYYCSLAEAKRASAKSDKSSKILFLHCPPVNQPLSTEEVTEAIKRSVIWLCGGL